MDSRFTFKDFVFVVLFFLVLGAVFLAMGQFNYQEQRLNVLRDQLQSLNDVAKQQTNILDDLRNNIRSGIHLSSATQGPSIGSSTQPASDTDPQGNIRRRNPDGSYYVYFPNVPVSPTDPRSKPDYAQGDWIVENLGDEPGTLTPYISRTTSDQAAENNILEGLLTRERYTLEYQPYVAESYTVLPDKLTYRFVIRKNAIFSDGKPVTADDVVFTYNTVMNPKIDADPYRPDMARITSCRKIDLRTVEIKFAEPYFNALGVCSFAIMPEHIYRFDKPENFNNNKATVVGSGPYRFDRWDRGQKLVLVRNENYWGPKPTFDRLVFLFVMNPQTAFQMFENGQFDEETPQPDQYEKFANDPEFAKKFHCYKYVSPNQTYRYIGWNEQRPMFKDKLTRQALTMLIDREAIIKTIQRGMAVITTGPFNPTSPQNDGSIKPWPYDPNGATKKLTEAGWKLNPESGLLEREGQPFKFELTIPASLPLYTRIAVYVKERLSKVGIQMTIVPFEFSVLSEHLDNRQFDAAMLGWGGGPGEEDPSQIWSIKAIEGKGSNYISFRNKEADDLINKAVHELDTDKRMAMWHRFHQIVQEEQPYTFLQSNVALAFINGRFKNTAPDKLGLDSGNWYVPTTLQKYH